MLRSSNLGRGLFLSQAWLKRGRQILRRRQGLCLGLLSLSVLAGCHQPDGLSDGFLVRYASKDPSYASFYECHGYACDVVSHVALTEEEWREVRRVFAPAAKDAREERRRIAEAIARLERLVGAHTGTSAHQWTRSPFHINGNSKSDPTQLDCIDEAVNNWTYLTMMSRDGLLRYHTVEKLAYAGGLPDFNFDLRNTAVIRATESGVYFAVDSTLVDAGQEPPIFPLAIWRGAWPPQIPPDTGDEPKLTTQR